jgi:4'-phosphopantetheinyl transferase
LNSRDILWPSVHEPPPLGDRDIHVWAVSLTSTDVGLSRSRLILSPDELDRAQRFRFDKHRNRYIAGRGALRSLLAKYTSRDASALKFNYSQHGKPSLEAVGDLHFNLSHSGDLALIAMTRIGEIGVDIEPVRELRDASDLVKRFFSTRESELFHRLPEPDRPEAFFNLWTRKESWLKATGDGISGGLSQVEVSFLKDEVPQVLSIAGSQPQAREWKLESLEPASGWIGAVAVRVRNGSAAQLSCLHFALG